MRVNRTMQFLTIVVISAACSKPADSSATPPDSTATTAAPAATPAAAPVVEAAPSIAMSVKWDSRPLDLAYRRAHDDMEARHKREIVSPRTDETAARRDERQASETKALELRYQRGKDAHSRTLPPTDR